MNNRFKCLFEEDEQQQQQYRYRNKKSYQSTYIQPLKTIVNEVQINNNSQSLINNDENFPTLSKTTTKTTTNITNQSTLTYESIVKNEIKIIKNKNKNKKIKRGWIELSKDINNNNNNNEYIQTPEENMDEYLFFINCMTNLYEHQKQEKIDILGEEKYNEVYKFQDYDYEYFDKLDEQYEDELEREMKQYEDEMNGYKSDISI